MPGKHTSARNGKTREALHSSCAAATHVCSTAVTMAGQSDAGQARGLGGPREESHYAHHAGPAP